MPHNWTVDLTAKTATHKDGWVFEFAQVSAGVFDGRLVKQPANLSPDQIRAAARIAREAGEAWEQARESRQ